MHIAASLMTVMARPSCTTVRLFGASHCHVLPLCPALLWGCGPPGGGGGPSLGDHPLGGGGGPSSLGWGTTRGGGGYTKCRGVKMPQLLGSPPVGTDGAAREEKQINSHVRRLSTALPPSPMANWYRSRTWISTTSYFPTANKATRLWVTERYGAPCQVKKVAYTAGHHKSTAARLVPHKRPDTTHNSCFITSRHACTWQFGGIP